MAGCAITSCKSSTEAVAQLSSSGKTNQFLAQNLEVAAGVRRQLAAPPLRLPRD